MPGTQADHYPPGVSQVSSKPGTETDHYPPGVSQVSSKPGTETDHYPPGVSQVPSKPPCRVHRLTTTHTSHATKPGKERKVLCVLGPQELCVNFVKTRVTALLVKDKKQNTLSVHSPLFLFGAICFSFYRSLILSLSLSLSLSLQQSRTLFFIT